MAKLTNKALEALRTHDKGRKLREDDGLVGMVRPRADGGVSVQWSWRYRFGGKVRQIACGTWPKATMPEIRKERERLAAIVEAGRDPADARAVVRLQARAEQLEDKAREQARIDEAEAQKARMTVKELFDLWELRMLCQHKDKGASVRQAFNRDVFSQIGRLAIEDVKKSHINAMIETTLARGVGRTAKLVLSLVRQMFRYAVEKDFIEADPTMAIRKAKIAKDSERERVLSEAEVTALYKALPGAKMAKTTELAMVIQLATACRIGELTQARWEHVDLEGGTWNIPPETAKNGKAHTVQLSGFAIKQFKALQDLTGTVENDDGETVPGTWLFPAKQKAAAVCAKTITKQIGDRQRGDKEAMSNRSPMTKALMLPGGQWTPHDLRRTAATMMVSLGVLPEVVERCLNHVEANKMKRIYQRHSYAPEMKAAWQLLGERLDLLTSGAKVVTIESRRKA